MKKELGKWLLSVAKYIVLVGVAGSVFSEKITGMTLVFGGLITLFLLALGLFLVKENHLNKRKNYNNNVHFQRMNVKNQQGRRKNSSSINEVK